MTPQILCGGREWLLLVVMLVVHHSSEAQEVQILDDALPTPTPPRTLLLGASVRESASWKQSPVETATEFCKCTGFSEDLVPGRTVYKPKLENVTEASAADGLELSLTFDDAHDPAFDSGPRSRAAVWQKVNHIAGAKRACGRGSRAGLFGSSESQLKLPTPIKVAAGVYTVGAWIRWPPVSDVPNSLGMRVLAAGFTGDLQVAVNGKGELGMGMINFELEPQDSSSNVAEKPIPANMTTAKNADNTVSPLDKLGSLELIDELLSNVTAGATLEPTQSPSMVKPSHSPTFAPGVRTTHKHNQTIDCQFYQWSKWATCNVTCGGGIQTRVRRVFAAAVNGGLACNQSKTLTKETRICNAKKCPIACIMSPWTPWSSCSKDCGGVGKQNRTRTVQNHQNHTEKCPALSESRACEAPVCDCVTNQCEPPAQSEVKKCMYLVPGEKSKRLVETEAQKKWCKLEVATKHIAHAAITRYRKGPQVVACDKQCKQRKERVRKLEHGRGTDELFAKKAEYNRVTKEKSRLRQRVHQGKQAKLLSKSIGVLQTKEQLKESEVRSMEGLVKGLKSHQQEVANEIKALDDQNAQIPVVLLTKNASFTDKLYSAMNDLNATQQDKENVTQSIDDLEKRKVALLSAPTRTPTPGPTMRVWGDELSPRFEGDGDARFKSSGFNMDWLTPGWHHLAAVADGSSTTFYIDSQAVGKVADVSKKEIYSIGNYQGGGFQWGAVDNLKVYSKALSTDALKSEMGCFIPLLASGKVTTSDPGDECSAEGLSIWDRKIGPWCTKSVDEQQFIKVDFGNKPQLITAIATSGGEYLVDGTAKNKGFVSQYELYYSDGSDEDFVPYKGATLETVANGNTDGHSTKLTYLHPPISALKVRIVPAKWTKTPTMRVELFGCNTANDNNMNVVIKSTVGGKSVAATCDKGYGITGGGCNALNAPQHILESAPEDARSWRCTGTGNMKAMAICAPLSFTGGTIIKEESGAGTKRIQTMPKTQGTQFVKLPEEDGMATATCPTTYKMVGGGCQVVDTRTSPFQYSIPPNDKSWVCGGNKGAKKAFVQCSTHPVFQTVAVHKNNVSHPGYPGWVSVSCPRGNTLIGGGCYASESADKRGGFFQFNGPDGKDKWTCGGHGFAKVAYGLCVNSTTHISEGDEPANSPGAQGKAQKNSISMTCKCPSKCNCPTRAEVGYITDPDLSDASMDTGYTFGSAGFGASTEYPGHPRKIPSCMCPARAATKLMLEFSMQAPSNLPEFEEQLMKTLDMATQTKDKTCGCKDDPQSCKCRIKMDKWTFHNGTEVKWQWRGSQDRWIKGRVDRVIAHVRIQSLLENGGDKWVFDRGAYHAGITAAALGDKISQAIADPDSSLRKSWFFMHISDASVANRLLNKCDQTMKIWTYRDPTSGEYNNGPAMWANLPGSKGFPRCGSGLQSPIALSDTSQSDFTFWDLNMSRADPSTTYSNAHDDRLQFDYTNVTAQLENEGLYLKVIFNQINGTLLFKEEGKRHQDTVPWNENRLKRGSFKLKQAVVHIPAEHTLDGVRHPMEVQYEHANEKGELATVSTILKFGVENAFLKRILADGVPPRCATGMQATKVQPEELFPLQADYFAYEGSETKPPCKSTKWYVYKQPATVSLVQWVDIAKKLSLQRKYVETCTRHGCSKTPIVAGKRFPFSDTLKGNVRPLQSQGGRIVRGSIKLH